MTQTAFPVIDLAATGKNIVRLRKAHGLSVRDLQEYFGFEMPQAIYKWQQGKCLPTVDNLFALSCILQTPMNEIIVCAGGQYDEMKDGQSTSVDCPVHFTKLMIFCIIYMLSGGVFTHTEQLLFRRLCIFMLSALFINFIICFISTIFFICCF